MEASEATQQTPTEGAQGAPEATEGATEAQAPDVLERLNQFEQSFDGFKQDIEQRLPSADGQGDELYVDERTGEVFDAQGNPVNFGESGQQQDAQGEDDWGADEFGPTPEEIAERAKAEALKEFEQRLEPMQQYMQDQQLAALEDQYPQLRDKGVAKDVFDQAVQRAQQYGNPELATSPRFLEDTYLVMRAREHASQETPAGADQGVALEAGGGQAPAEEPDPIQQMIEAKKGGATNAFWTG